MLDNILKDRVNQLSTTELKELYNYIEKKIPPSVVYYQKPIRCGCKKCKEGGKGHGNYWYAYFTYKGKTHCVYVGKEKREIDPLKELRKKKSKARR